MLMGAKSQGIQKDRYQLITRVLIFPVDDKGRVLLLKGAADKKIWAKKWNGEGGHLEQGEGILEASKRKHFEKKA